VNILDKPSVFQLPAPKLMKHIESEPDENLDYKLVKWMSKTWKLQGIPPSAFYCKEHKNLGENFIRFCYIKEDENLAKAADILKNMTASLDVEV
jgi:aspartate/methionine/tyrosine aminotransferase